MIMSNWTKRVEFCYRVFVNIYFDELIDHFMQVEDKERKVTFSEIEDDYWPIEPEKIKSISDKGFLITDHNDRPCIIVRSIVVSVWFEQVATFFESFFEEIEKKVKLKKFAAIRIIDEKIANFQAL